MSSLAPQNVLAQMTLELPSFIESTGMWIANHPLEFIVAVAIPLLLVSLLMRLHPTPLLLRWGIVACLMSAAASTSGGVSVAALVASCGAGIWMVSNWYPRIQKRMIRYLSRAITAALMVVFLVTVWLTGLLLVAEAAILFLFTIDIFTVPRRKSLQFSRNVLKIVSLDQHHDVEIVVRNHARRTLWFELRDDVPQEFEAVPANFDIRLRRRKRMSFHYALRAKKRGQFHLDCLHVRFRSLLGAWNRYVKYDEPSTLHVYPDMKQLAEYAMLARSNRLSLMGVKRTRKIGQDNEFERLRDYTVDDNFRHIDWRSTARRNKLTVRDFQVNQSQRLIFMLDCGRMMTNEAQGISLLDHSINAMLMASYVALSQGDSVGLICFSDRIHSFVPPRGGMKQMNQLLHSVFNRHPQMVESRYDEAFLYLRTHCLKRSLVVMISNVIDEVNAMQVEQYLATLVGRHLPLGVLLRDRRLFALADQQPTRPLDAFSAAAAAEIVAWRQQLLVDLTHRGVLALDVFPEDMTAPLVNQYLQIKARHLL